jgi:hypothetical protein
MVAYSFNKRFEVAIREGWKTQTIRKGRARHARPGEFLQLFCGMRTAHCRRIVEDVRCIEVTVIVISFDDLAEINSITTNGAPVADLDAFAVADGFTDSSDMSAFWRASHSALDGMEFIGVLIEWAAPHRDAPQ